MSWIIRTEPVKDPHEFCKKPLRRGALGMLSAKAPGEPGDLWRCDVCGKLWTINAWGRWREAGWWLRLVHRADGWTAVEDKVESARIEVAKTREDS